MPLGGSQMCIRDRFDEAVEFLAIDFCGEGIELGDVNGADAFVRGVARDEADEAGEGNTRGVGMIAALDGVDHRIEAGFGTAGNYGGWNGKSHEAKGN